MAIKNKALLTKRDLAVAAFSVSEVYNSYLEKYEEQDYGELTKEEMETSLNSLRVVFQKLDAILMSTESEVADESR